MCDILSTGRRGYCRFKCVISSPLGRRGYHRFDLLLYPLRPVERISHILNSRDYKKGGILSVQQPCFIIFLPAVVKVPRVNTTTIDIIPQVTTIDNEGKWHPRHPYIVSIVDCVVAILCKQGYCDSGYIIKVLRMFILRIQKVKIRADLSRRWSSLKSKTQFYLA